MNECTCLNCGWVHMGVTREHAEQESRKFMDYYDGLDEKERHEFYGGDKTYERVLSQYERCFFCGQTDPKNYRPSLPGDCPGGCTIQPVIWGGGNELPRHPNPRVH